MAITLSNKTDFKKIVICHLFKQMVTFNTALVHLKTCTNLFYSDPVINQMYLYKFQVISLKNKCNGGFFT